LPEPTANEPILEPIHKSSARFGQMLRSLRTTALLSQEQLSHRSGLSVRTIRDLERGRVVLPRSGSVRLLSEALGLEGAARDRFEQSSRWSSPAEPEPTEPRVRHLNRRPQQIGPDRHFALPAQLPLDSSAFVGRCAELARLNAVCAESRRRSTAVGLVTLTGGPGVGKTYLAVHWAQQIRGAFPDGQLYLNLRGFGPSRPPLTPTQAIRGLLETLGFPPERMPESLDAQAALYRSALANRRALVLLDNARSAEQVRPLLPGAPGCLVIVTSREHLAGLVAAEGARPLPVDLLTVDDARELLARRVGVDLVDGGDGNVDEIIDGCARLPLALAILAARAAVRPRFSLGTLAAELRIHAGLDAFAHLDAVTDLRRTFSWSYDALSADAARLFRVLGRHGEPDPALEVAAAIAGLTPTRARRALAELVDGHLVVERGAGEFGTHLLLRAYAEELAAATVDTVAVTPVGSAG